MLQGETPVCSPINPPPPNQQDDGFPLQFLLEGPQTQLRTLSQSCEQTLQKLRTQKIGLKNVQENQKFRKGVDGQRRLARGNPPCARDSGLLFCALFPTPLGEGGHISGELIWRFFGLCLSPTPSRQPLFETSDVRGKGFTSFAAQSGGTRKASIVWHLTRSTSSGSRRDFSFFATFRESPSHVFFGATSRGIPPNYV